MFRDEIINTIQTNLLHVSSVTIEEEVHYPEVISTFSRMYLIKKGTGRITIGEEVIELKAGNLYLIPSFDYCSYQFDPGLEQFYIHFSTENKQGLNIYDLSKASFERSYTLFEFQLFERMIQLHPNQELPSANPTIYQSKYHLQQKIGYYSLSHQIETKGMLLQLLSRFLLMDIVDQETEKSSSWNLKSILRFIQNHLHEDITVQTLADLACFSTDHFTRTFKAVTGSNPKEFITKKRIEKAQNLLVNTNLSITEIVEQTGFSNASYFSKVFKKQTQLSPRKYRVVGMAKYF